MPESTVQKTYLLDDVEVVLTGRIARRELKNNKIDERLEIQPADAINGSWKKWVRRAELYTIRNYTIKEEEKEEGNERVSINMQQSSE
jgi:hypothetical protein